MAGWAPSLPPWRVPLALAVVAMVTGVLSEAPFLIVGVAAGLMLLPIQAGGLIGAASGRNGGASKRKFKVLLAEDSGYGWPQPASAVGAGRSCRPRRGRWGQRARPAAQEGSMDVMLIDLHLRSPSALDIVRMYRFMRSEDANLPIVGLAPGLNESAQTLHFSRNERGAADAGGRHPACWKRSIVWCRILSARQALESG